MSNDPSTCIESCPPSIIMANDPTTCIESCPPSIVMSNDPSTCIESCFTVQSTYGYIKVTLLKKSKLYETQICFSTGIIILKTTRLHV